MIETEFSYPVCEFVDYNNGAPLVCHATATRQEARAFHVFRGTVGAVYHYWCDDHMTTTRSTKTVIPIGEVDKK